MKPIHSETLYGWCRDRLTKTKEFLTEKICRECIFSKRRAINNLDNQRRGKRVFVAKKQSLFQQISAKRAVSSTLHKEPWAKESWENWQYSNLFLLPRRRKMFNSAHNHWFYISRSQKIGVCWKWRCLRSKWQTIHSTLVHIFCSLLLLLYPTNIIPRTHVPLETSFLTVASLISSLGFPCFSISLPPLHVDIPPRCLRI